MEKGSQSRSRRGQTNARRIVFLRTRNPKCPKSPKRGILAGSQLREAGGACDFCHELNDLITRPSGSPPECNPQERFLPVFGTDHFKTVTAKSKAAAMLEQDAAPLGFA